MTALRDMHATNMEFVYVNVIATLKLSPAMKLHVQMKTQKESRKSVSPKARHLLVKHTYQIKGRHHHAPEKMKNATKTFVYAKRVIY